jgi:serine phosphatase RsbU (regulator of sigma subunit)
MKLFEHIKSYFYFWKPSIARRISLYFLIFGLIIFLVTSILYTIGAKKKFLRSASHLVHHQFSQLENSSQPDFLWSSIDQPHADLSSLLEMLTDVTSSFFSVTDASIYAKDSTGVAWYRLYFDDANVLRSNPVQDSYIAKLNRWLRRHFRPADAKIYSGDATSSMFINITGDRDTNYYFLKMGIDSEGLAGFMHHQVAQFVGFFIVALILLRFCGYYFARKISRPIEKLSSVAANVAKGDLSKLVPIPSNDEFGQLAVNFNRMIEGLREWERIKVIEFELEKGQQIQREFLPTSIPYLPNWDIATFFDPAGKVSGDFYDVFTLPDKTVGLVIADVCDKGVGSALYMALFRSLIRVFAEQAAFCNTQAAARVDQLSIEIAPGMMPENEQMTRLRAVPFTNNYIAQTHGDEGMFATLFFGVLDPLTGKLYYINGGHEPLYVVGTSGIKRNLDPTGPAVGMMPDTRFSIQQIDFDPGDVLVGYTDGVTEARSPEDVPFTRNRLKSILNEPFKSASELVERITKNLFTFIDIAPRSDDVTMLAIQRSL